MNIEEVRNFCLNLQAVTESLPFGEDALVFKVENKMFLLLALDASEPFISIKCDPEKILILQDKFDAAQQAWHFNKKHWITIYLDRDMPTKEVKLLIKESYRLVLLKLPLKIREKYQL